MKILAYKKSTLVFTTICIVLVLLVSAPVVWADDPCKNIGDLDDKAECYEKEIENNKEKYESTSKKLQDIRSQKEDVTNKISELLGQLNTTQAQLDEVQADIDELSAELSIIEKNLQDKNGQLKNKLTFRDKVLRNYTKRGDLNELEIIFSTDLGGTYDTIVAPSKNVPQPQQQPSQELQSQQQQQQEVKGVNTTSDTEQLNLSGFQFSTLAYMFNSYLNKEAKRVIEIINSEIDSYTQDKLEAEEIKKELEQAQASLISAKLQVEAQKSNQESELGDLKGKETDYETELKSLSQKIDDLSSKQQEVLNKKFGEGYFSIGDGETPSANVPSPKFKPAYGAFSYGAYTHYRGLSQYGAKGRAESGQNYKDIIEFYYDHEVTEKDDFPSKICVQGYGDLDFQYYLYGLGEMPSSWPKEALKAQAVAARTYAYRFYKAGTCICTTQSCQVFIKSKADNPPSEWKDAVDDTKKKIISGDVHAMYSASTGGYIDDGIGWDVDGSWPGGAYEKKGKSPWFYWPWYTETYNFSSSTCGRDGPWLNEEEMADILNSWVVWDKGNSSDRDRISPVTTSCWGGNPYSIGAMKDRADELGDDYSSVSDIDVSISNSGRTASVTFSTNRGNVTIDGEEIKTVFNLRAPGYIAIRSRLFDFQIED